MDYIERLTKRREALVSAYKGEESKPEHRDAPLVLIDVLVDIELAARVGGRSLDDLIAEAKKIADREWYFAGPLLQNANGQS